MGTISITTPSDGQTIDASDVTTPLNTIVSEINGSLDSNNIASGGVVPNALVSGTGTSWVWQDFTPSPTGFSGTPTVHYARYIQVGKAVTIQVYISGTSNSANKTITPPVTPKTVTSNQMLGYSINEHTSSNPLGAVIATSSAVQIYGGFDASVGSGPFSGWPTSGSAWYRFTVTYEAA